MTLRVADLFCGGGGISEGLRQAGFQIVYATDKDRAAALTFKKNHPEAQVEVEDVSELDPQDIPEFDILVGGPPCIEFSASKGNRGNILEGLRLVQAYLRVVYERNPRYWIMENVPRIILHLPEDIPLRWIGIDEDGYLHVPVRAEFNCAEFGIPQARKRFLMGNFPLPGKTSFDPKTDALFGQAEGRTPWRTLSEVLDALPDPMNGAGAGSEVNDPNYDIRLPIDKLSNHFHTVALNKRETRSIRRAKESHPYMGFMPFPDRTDVPARTVVATQLGRETLVLSSEADDGTAVYRRATVRECASLQTFPTTYQFFGNSIGARYRIVGDAVPPRLTYLIGKEIRRIEDSRDAVTAPIIWPQPLELSPPVVEKPRKRPDTPMQWTRKFAELVPGKEVRGCRVELDNQGESPASAGGAYAHEDHKIEWVARLYVGEGRKTLRWSTFSFDEALSIVAPACVDKNFYNLIERLLVRAENELPSILCDATTLQAVWTNRSSVALGPEDIVDRLSEMVDDILPKVEFANTFIRTSMDGDFLPNKGLRVRLATGLVVTAFASECINSAYRWLAENSDRRFIPDDWEQRKTRERNIGPSSIRPVEALATMVDRELERTLTTSQIA